MGIVLMDALSPLPIAMAVKAAVNTLGVVTRVHALRSERYAPCEGCFECWVAHPGSCKATNAANQVMADLASADEVVWALKPVFGCWDHVAKQALDKTIGMLLPFFSSVDGETHHKMRHGPYPRLGVVAVMPAGAPAAERELFIKLVTRNAINMHSVGAWVAFVQEHATADEITCAVTEARTRPLDRLPTLPPFVAQHVAAVCPPREGRRVVLCVGSAKPTGTSTSEILGRALLQRLERCGWETLVVHLSRVVRLGSPEVPALEDALATADLLVLATPVYVDSLPALVLAALEGLTRHHRRGNVAILPVVQCGFPELSHTVLALQVLERAAAVLGWHWAGHLAMGAGGAMQNANLTEAKGMARHQVAALDQVTSALDAGQPVAESAMTEFSQQMMSPALYRAAGNLGWLVEAWKHHAVHRLWEAPAPQPHAAESGSAP